ncbi:hypothetical protein I0C86_07310 [Plantactinospora sp. S1510]|uniref:Uncharacterized protein n=1 Tax=Plantactinospora alkalitolerans TaxID=2789879 RepID=A0ABS0GRI2_9ACTN|nr:DUF6081 family protein [Plantactinospora alkalitolerans]MBF9128792.1 hypothetical protein [Plantactinospora alkalitolerans]
MYDFATDLADRLSAWPRVDYADLPATRAALRAAVAHHRPYQPARPVEIGDRLVPGPPGAVRVYRPDADRPQPAPIYLHRGGFVTRDVETVHQTCLRLADRIDANPGTALSFEAWLSGRTYGTAGHPFGAAVADPDDDLRLPSVAMPVLDTETAMVFDFLLLDPVGGGAQRFTDEQNRPESRLFGQGAELRARRYLVSQTPSA